MPSLSVKLVGVSTPGEINTNPEITGLIKEAIETCESTGKIVDIVVDQTVTIRATP